MILSNLQTAAGEQREGRLAVSSSSSQLWLPAITNIDDLILGKVVASNIGYTPGC